MAQQTVVVVVDDDASLLKSVARLLACHGIESRTFASAEALLESGSVQTATCFARHSPRGNFGDCAAAPACSIGIKVPRRLHDRERRRGHAQ